MIKGGDYATVVAIFQEQYKKGESLTITGDGHQRRDFTHVDDIVDGIIKCVGRKSKADEYELGSGKNYSIREVARMFGTSYTFIPARPGEYDKTLCDYSKALNDLGYNPSENLENYILNWIKKLD